MKVPECSSQDGKRERHRERRAGRTAFCISTEIYSKTFMAAEAGIGCTSAQKVAVFNFFQTTKCFSAFLLFSVIHLGSALCAIMHTCVYVRDSSAGMGEEAPT